MIITANDSVCWRCARKRLLTKHHCLPSHFKPRHNVIIPLCKECHNELNVDHSSYILAFAVKLELMTKKLSEMVKRHFKRKEWNKEQERKRKK